MYTSMFDVARVKSGEQWIIRTITQHEIADFCWVPENLDTRRLVLGPTNFSLFFQLIFLKHFSLEPARILDFLASDSICKYQNRQTNLLNCMDLTRVKIYYFPLMRSTFSTNDFLLFSIKLWVVCSIFSSIEQKA